VITETSRLQRAAVDLDEYRFQYAVAAVERRHAALAAHKAKVIIPKIAEHLGTTLSNTYRLINAASEEPQFQGLSRDEIAAIMAKEPK